MNDLSSILGKRVIKHLPEDASDYERLLLEDGSVIGFEKGDDGFAQFAVTSPNELSKLAVSAITGVTEKPRRRQTKNNSHAEVLSDGGLAAFEDEREAMPVGSVDE